MDYLLASQKAPMKAEISLSLLVPLDTTDCANILYKATLAALFYTVLLHETTTQPCQENTQDFQLHNTS